VKAFWHSFGTVGGKLEMSGIDRSREVLCFQRNFGATRRG
jgi:hypothetical protein